MTINGQLSVFDLYTGNRRPCDYSFSRYIGQRVQIMIGAYPGVKVKGRITEVMPYYTTIKVDSGEKYMATPYSLSPEE